MTDLSKVFKTTVKAIKLNLNINDLNQELGLKPKPVSKHPISFNTSNEALKLVKNITQLKDALIKNKSYYIQPNYLIDNHHEIGDVDREKFENEAESVIRSCSDTLKLIQDKAFNQTTNAQYKSHLQNLFFILEKYLKDVCKIYTEQKAIQVQRTIEKKNFSQLYTPSAFSSTNRLTTSYDYSLDEQKANGDNELFNIDEIQLFEQENDYLYETLTTNTQEMRQIQSQVVEIARLQEVFAEKILEQDSTIDVIQTTSINTNEDIKQGNESIKEAMKNNAALRIWILFTIIILSFTLLFLDWYND